MEGNFLGYSYKCNIDLTKEKPIHDLVIFLEIHLIPAEVKRWGYPLFGEPPLELLFCEIYYSMFIFFQADQEIKHQSGQKLEHCLLFSCWCDCGLKIIYLFSIYFYVLFR